MVGRRRRTSDSTTATLDPEAHVYTDELAVLKRFDQALEDEDAMLQTFVLEDATVYDKAGHPVELFTVRTGGPFTIRGRVVIGEEQKSRAKKPTTKTALIETKQCIRYAIGSSEHEGFVTYGAWAGGQAGWYEIRPPSAAYKPIYDRMIEGVSIYYTVMTLYEEHAAQKNKAGKKTSKKRGRKSASAEQLDIEKVLFKYAVAMGDGATYEEVVARCDDHAPFLISHFYEDSNAFDWPPTSFFQWIVDRHPDIHANVLESRKKKPAGAAIKDELPEETEAIDSPTVTDEPPAQKTLSKHQQRNPSQDTHLASNEVDTNDFATSNSQRSIRSRSRAKTKTQSRSPPPVDPAADHLSITEAMEVDAAPQMPPEAENDQVPGQRSHVDMILEGLEELRPELEPITKTTFSKVSSKLYYKCTIKHYLGSGEILKYYAKELLERLDESAWGESGFWKTLEETASGPRCKLEHVTVDQISASLVRRKAKTMKSEPGVSSKGIAMETPPPKRVGRPAGKMSALRLVGSKGSKRRLDPTEDTPTTVSRGFKTAKISHIYDSEEDQPMDNASSSGDSNDESELDVAESPAALKLVIRAENFPTTEPKGPNGTWVCDEDDCGFVVRNADQQEGRERIQEHIQEAHYEDDENRDTRINLAVTEGVKNHLPIDHLLEKIRRMGQKALEKEGLSVDDVPMSQPIKRRLIS